MAPKRTTKRKEPDTGSVVKEIDHFRSFTTKTLNSASFQSFLQQDLNSLKRALALSDLVGHANLDTSRSYLGNTKGVDTWCAPLVRWAQSGSVLDAKDILKQLFVVFCNSGFFNRPASYDAALASIAVHGSEFQLRLCLDMPNKLDMISMNEGDDRVQRFALCIFLQTSKLYTDQLALQMVSKATVSAFFSSPTKHVRKYLYFCFCEVG